MCAPSEPLCFKHKIKTLQFGAGAKTFPKNYYDSEAVDYIFGGKEGREEYLDVMEGVPLKWDGKTPYRQDQTGDWTKATEKDMQRVMYGSASNERKIHKGE